jgi:hypothetical protein
MSRQKPGALHPRTLVVISCVTEGAFPHIIRNGRFDRTKGTPDSHPPPLRRDAGVSRSEALLPKVHVVRSQPFCTSNRPQTRPKVEA